MTYRLLALAPSLVALLVGCANSSGVHGTGAGGHGGGTTGTPSAGGGTTMSSSSSGTGGTGGTGGTTTSPSSSSSGTVSGPCAGKIGTYCGGTLGLDPGTLYSCNGDMPMVQKTCGAGCVMHGSGGDACACPSGDGAYCGQAVGGDSTRLYDCTGGVITQKSQCAGTCQVMPPGKADTCGTCPSGDGLYCGSGINMDPSTLYDCKGGVLTVSQHCPSPCKVNPPGTADACGGCPSGNGLYCGATLGMDPNTLYDCNNGNVTVSQACPSTCHVAPPGQADYCNGNGQLLCSSLQWWNVGLTQAPYQLTNGGITWWDTDLAVGNNTPVQLRHDSKLIQAPVEPWGWQPRFLDMTTGKTFQLLHLHPQSQYTTAVGTVYPAGTIVGLSGGGTADTGLGTYSTGPHLCVETEDTWQSTFPKGTDPCH